MKKRSALILSLLSSAMLLALYACVSFHPVQMDTDPNAEQKHRTENQTDAADTEAFIAAHPELDNQTKKELRAGVINRQEALRRHPELMAPSPAPTPLAK